MRIGANPSLLALGAMQKHQSQLGKSLQRLSSGLRVNSAGDGVAETAMSEKMTAQLRGQRQASENVQAGIDMFRTADGALSEIQDALQRMRELSVHAANGTLTEDDRSYIQTEIDGLTRFIDDTIGSSHFNRIELFKERAMTHFADAVIANIFEDQAEMDEVAVIVGGLLDQDETVSVIYQNINDAILTYLEEHPPQPVSGLSGEAAERPAGGNSVVLQAGANEGDRVAFDLGTTSLRILGIENLDVTTQENAARAITRLDDALKTVGEHRALVGAEINRMEHIVSNLEGSTINLDDARSRIMDADIAKELMAFVKANLLSQGAGNIFQFAEESRARIAELAMG